MIEKDNNDILIKEFLTKEIPNKPSENPLFTRKVMNRLPDKKQNYNWIENFVYIFCSIICLAGWIYMVVTADLSVITLGEIVKYAVLVCATLGLMCVLVYRPIVKD